MDKLLQNKKRSTIVIMICAILLLAVTSYTKSLQGQDSITKGLLWNSENLVYNAMLLSYQPGQTDSYGLSELYPYNGAQNVTLTDENLHFDSGYCETDKIIAVHDNEFTRRVYAKGNTITFFSGDKADILETYSSDGYLFLKYEADRIYSNGEQGDLRYVSVYNNEEKRYMQVGESVGYESQIGLQGMLFSMFPKEYTINEMRTVYKWILAFLYAIVLSLICYGIYKKYNIRFAVVFYMVTLLAPWTIGYATNLYWVEFTWFLPMLFGLYCANHIESQKARILSYIGVMASIALKSACGYEYISTIMMSAIVFLLADFTVALIEKKDKQEWMRLFKTIFVMGVFALAGFVIVLLIHAYMRGGGNLYNGLRSIYYNDVLRRTLGGDPNMFQDVYADSLNASVIRVVLRYLLFNTPVILGVPGWLFIPLIMLSFFAAVYAIWKKKGDKQMMALYIWMGLASVSWFVLGKSHSYIHTGMNFVMWYFGFVQIMFYLVAELVWTVAKRRKV